MFMIDWCLQCVEARVCGEGEVEVPPTLRVQVLLGDGERLLTVLRGVDDAVVVRVSETT